MSSEAIPTTPATWRDISGEIALIANAPWHFYPHPNPSDPRIVPEETALKFAPYAAEFEAWAIENVASILGDRTSMRRDRYLPGKYASGGPFEHVGVLLSLVPDAFELAQQITTLVQLGEYVARLKRKWVEIFRRDDIKLGPSDSLVFAAILVEALCAAHAVRAYGQTGMVARVNSVCRPDLHCSALHPCGRERYSVEVNLGDAVYFYTVDGHGVATEHFRIGTQSVTPLALPNFDDLVNIADPR